MKNTSPQIYLDYSATTPVDPRVVDAMMPYFTDSFGNASSIHSFGRKAKIPLEESREKIAGLIGAAPGEVFFTSGGTEADNHALFGAMHAAGRLHGKKHLAVSAIEHHAVLHAAENLKESGYDVSVLPVDSTGKVVPDSLAAFLTPNTSVVSVMHANNEIGTIQDIPDIARIVHEHGALLHSDTVQSTGKIPVDVKKLSVDLLAISAHKFYGPKGIGAIYIRRGVEVDSLMFGGAQERNRRAGTENVPLAVGFATALELSVSDLEKETRRLAELKRKFYRLLSDNFNTILFNGHPTDSLPHIVNISFDTSKVDVDGETLLLNMDLRGVAVTSGSACSSGSMEPSHVLQAIGRTTRTAKASIRFSMGKYTTEEEITKAATILKEVVAQSSAVRA
ncbi:MAG TPA: cysteine desulfurase family protein [Bacteroidota bacterium]|nr:cysteine desulfurase family protein [Bacteroidota bacterium]